MFDHCLYFNTTALARRLDRMWTDAFKPMELTPPQGFLLRAVLRHPGMLQGELAEALAITRPTATRALDGLVAKKLIVRRPSAADGREVEVHPTQRAFALQTELDRASAAATAKIKKVIGDNAFADVVTKLRRVRIALD